ncbi:MAG: hypothetical protein KKD00_09825 [Gammaproteobacteria bacterium]|nr:hypothetical protein [Gammaproteobacteria bacterium]
MLLHLPLLALLSPFWSPQPSAGQDSVQPLQVELSLESGTDQPQVTASTDVDGVPESTPDDTATPVDTTALVAPLTATAPLQSPSFARSRSPSPSPAPAPPVVVTSSLDISNTRVLQATEAPDNGTVQTLADPDLSVEPVSVAAATEPELPATVAMTGEDARLIEAALQALIEEINDTGTGFASAPTPESLGLSAADSIAVSAVPLNDLNTLQQFDVTVTRYIDGQAYQMNARLRERALSYYAKFINRWDDNVMLSNDRVDGRFHANSVVNFETSADARPQFNGEVTIAGRQSVSRRLQQSGMFADGLRTGTGRIRLPEQALPGFWRDTGATVITLDSDAQLQFEGENGVLWTDADSHTQTRLSVPPAGLVITGTGRTRIELSGTVAGNVLVHSARQLIITNDLVYANTSATSADSLALISEGSIEIAPASVTGAGDLEIHGALYARQRFSVRRFRDRHQGTLYIYGTLVAGSVSATEPRFDTHIQYDNRFEQMRPPAFPSTGLVDLLHWDQQWAAVTDSDALLADAADNAPPAAP